MKQNKDFNIILVRFSEWQIHHTACRANSGWTPGPCYFGWSDIGGTIIQWTISEKRRPKKKTMRLVRIFTYVFPWIFYAIVRKVTLKKYTDFMVNAHIEICKVSCWNIIPQVLSFGVLSLEDSGCFRWGPDAPKMEIFGGCQGQVTAVCRNGMKTNKDI